MLSKRGVRMTQVASQKLSGVAIAGGRRWVVSILLVLLAAQLPGAAWARSALVGHSCLAGGSPVVELGALGFFDTLTDFDLSSGTPSLALLQTHDVALIYTNCAPGDPVGLGDVLADYVDGGGRIVVATYSFSSPWGIAGRVTTTGYLPLINVSVNGDVSGALNPTAPLDPVFSFPNSITPGSLGYFHNSNFTHPGIDAGASVLADDGFGNPLLAINAAQTVAGLNLFPEGANYGGNNNEFYRFLENTLARVRFLCNSNGILDTGEDCDDGNASNGDGCDSLCRVEPCYSCAGEPSTCSSLPDGSACIDGLFCNGADTCSSAACTVHVGDPCIGGAECNNVCNEASNTCAVTAGTACTDDTNECTYDQCDGMGACIHPGNFNSCDDGMFCNGPDQCSGGSCSFHFGDPCLFASECNNVCDEPSGMCTPTMVDTPCSDDGTVCTTDHCDGSGACVHPPVASGLPCPSDLNECTTDECDGAGVCGHPPIMNGTPCTDDGNECTDDECDGAATCGHPAVMNGTGCDDSDACTQTDQCQSGSCVGSNPIVCPAPLCHGAGTCDPSSGACTSCPAGYSPGGGGCQKTYAIDASLLDNQASFCDVDGINRYNGCSTTPWGFHWTDAGDAGVGNVIRADVQFVTGVECSFLNHGVTLNATSIGGYSPTFSCSCVPPHTTQLLADVDTSTYLKGGLNAVAIDGFDCEGLSQDPDGSYAVVTVTYADPGYALLVEPSCRAALKSKFKYKNNANDEKDKLKWKWGKGDATTPAEFGNPTTSATYELCIFGESSGGPTLLFGADVPASASLWSAIGTTGYKYNDVAATQDGIKGALLRSGGVGKAKILVKGKGGGLSDPSLPLAPGTTGIRLQLTNESNGKCWESEFPLSSITADAQGIKAAVP